MGDGNGMVIKFFRESDGVGRGMQEAYDVSTVLLKVITDMLYNYILDVLSICDLVFGTLKLGFDFMRIFFFCTKLLVCLILLCAKVFLSCSGDECLRLAMRVGYKGGLLES